MCGGGSPRTTINQADYGAYNRMADAQLATMALTQSPAVINAQQGVQAATLQQQQVLTDLAAARTAQANDTSAAASRLAALIGTPPPDKTARAPVLAANRQGMSRPTGRKGLRVDLNPAAGSSGLNIGGY
jgi:hypothetical protein